MIIEMFYAIGLLITTVLSFLAGKRVEDKLMDIYDEIGQVDIEDLSEEMQEKIGNMGMLVSALYVCGAISFVILMLKIIIKIYSN